MFIDVLLYDLSLSTFLFLSYTEHFYAPIACTPSFINFKNINVLKKIYNVLHVLYEWINSWYSTTESQ